MEIMKYHKVVDDSIYSPGDWHEALPLGNGAMGAMVYGGCRREYLQLNEESVWYKGQGNRVNKDAYAHVSEIQNLLLEGKTREAEQLVAWTMHSTPAVQGHYEPLANVELKFHYDDDAIITDYEKQLNLTNALAQVAYTINGALFQRELFISAVDHVLVVKLHKEGTPIDMSISMQRDKNFEGVCIKEDIATLQAICGGSQGTHLACSLMIHEQDGELLQYGDTFVLKQVQDVVILISGHTNFYGEDEVQWNQTVLRKAHKYTYEQLKQRHIKEYQNYYQRMSFTLDEEEEIEDINEVLASVKQGETCNALIPLYFQYCRYLLISCSRPGTLPANLQGIWNKEYNPKWDSKYTININTEMNYWPSEVCNLSECHLPLLDLLKKMLPQGQKVAKEMYGCRGFVAHHNTDIWGDCAPQGAYLSSSQWNMGAAWLCTHLYEHYAFQKDEEFLKEAYPIMKEAALFLCDYLIETKEGVLYSAPSLSPENAYIGNDGKAHHICYAPSSDIQIVRELFQDCIKAAKQLDMDTAFQNELQEKLKKLPPHQIGKFGQLQEWIEDYEEVEPGHRHAAHMMALYPFAQITVDDTPALAQACRKTLERRAYYGAKDGMGWLTGWAHAWMINIWARLRDGEQAYAHLQAILQTYTAPNLFDLHPPFQIDGNFGALAGIAEMLLQSHKEELFLLPALPNHWQQGHITGLRGRGGYEVEIMWKDGVLQRGTISCAHTQTLRIRMKSPFSIYKEDGEMIPAHLENNTWLCICDVEKHDIIQVVHL